jgi:2,3-bisphosphoglycerate-dependent phosphoglycerate mutase
MPKLILLRHGQSEWNKENRFTGWVDVDLAEAGKAEARQAGTKLKGIRLDLAFTSALKRAQNTLELAMESAGLDLPVTKDKALNERMYGDLQGLNKADTAAKYGDEQVHIWRRSFDIAPPNGESLKDTADRVIPYFQTHIVPNLKAGKNIIIAAHGNSLRALIMHLEGLSPAEILKIEIPTGQPKMYELDDQLKVLNSRYL